MNLTGAFDYPELIHGISINVNFKGSAAIINLFISICVIPQLNTTGN